MSLANQVFKLAMHLVTMLVVAVFLSPEDLGLFSVALSIQAFGVILRDGGLANSLIQKKDLRDIHLNSVFWTSVAISLVLAAGLMLAARPLAQYYEQPELASILWMVAIPIVAQSLGAVQEAQLRRNLRFGRILLADSGSAALASLVAILAIAMGAGVHGLMLRIVIGPVLLSVFCWLLAGWHPRWQFSLGALRVLWVFGGFMFLTALMGYGATRVDAFIIPALIGFNAAGLFSMARNLALTPVQELSNAVARVMFPAFSAAQDQPAILRSGYRNGARCLATLVFPIIAAIVALSPEAVRLLLPEKWAGTTPIIQTIALLGALHCVNGPAIQLLYARGRSGQQFVYTLVSTPVAILSLVVGARWGVMGVAVCWTVMWLVMAPVVLWLAGREIDLRWVEALGNVARPAAAAAGAVVAVRSLCWAWSSAGQPVGHLLLALEFVVGAVVYGGLGTWLLRDTLGKIRRDLAAALFSGITSSQHGTAGPLP